MKTARTPAAREQSAAQSLIAVRTVLIWLAGLVALPAGPAFAADTLEEPAADDRVFEVEHRLEVKGTLETALQGGKAQAHPLSVSAGFDYRERRLTGTGRDAEAFRSIRSYDLAKAAFQVDKEEMSSILDDALRIVVAQGKRSGVLHFCLDAPLTAVDVELLRACGDSLANLALLPPKPVAKGDEWACESWVLQMLTGTDAVLKSDLRCKLISIDEAVAKVEFSGQLEGASAGASTKISVSGKYEYDVAAKYLRRMEFEEKEKRALGTKPGYDVVMNVVVKRKPAKNSEPLTDELIASVPLDPGESYLQLRFDLPWGAQFLHDRDWHVFRQTPQSAVLRLIDKGSFVAQCNVSKVVDAEPGQHTSEQQFQEDIQKSLGDKLKEIAKAEELESDDGVFRYRVTAVGQVGEISMTWLYYLCAAPSGKQVAFVFAVETPLLERLGNRDLAIVSSLVFRNLDPTPATSRR
jgi:hypothetical protein